MLERRSGSSPRQHPRRYRAQRSNPSCFSKITVVGLDQHLALRRGYSQLRPGQRLLSGVRGASGGDVGPRSAWRSQGRRSTSRRTPSRMRRMIFLTTDASTCAAAHRPLPLSLRNGEVLVVEVSGPLIVDNADLTIRAAIDGQGLTFSFEEHLAPQIASGALVRVLGDWCAVRWVLSLLSESAAAVRGAHGADRHASLGP